MNTMKKTIFALIMLSIAMIGCKKADIQSDEKGNLKSSDLAYGIDITLPDLNQNVDQLVLNPDDAQDEKINKYLYYLSCAIEDLVKNGSFNHAVIDLAKQSPNQTANLVTLLNSYPAYKTAINQKLSNKFLTFDQIATDLTYIKDNISETYSPCIFIPNLDRLDPDKQPIFSPNIEVDCSNNEAIEDNVAAWYFTIAGEKISVMLSEENSEITKNPIFLLDNGEINPKSNNFEIHPPDDDYLKSTQTTTSFSSYEYQADHRYETNGGKTEFTVVAYRISPQGTWHWIYNSNGWKEIAKIPKNDIGKLLYKWSLHCGNYTPYNQNYVYWNTYERDWNRSEKSLGDVNANGVTLHLSGRRKNGFEWYSYDPANLQGKNTDLNFIYSNWAKWHENDKCRFRIWRVEL